MGADDQYSRHVEWEQNAELPSRFLDPHSVDNWRHTRMLDMTSPLWGHSSSASWITVGDGRYGSDAAYLHSHGVSAVATSLTDERLRYAYELGYISGYRVENAEHLVSADDEFDYVLCKEAYHHFPRPPVALYEMLRVARVAVVLIEPLDNPKVLDWAKWWIKRLIRGDHDQQFEPSGNFLYRLDVGELGKLVTAMGGEVLAFKGLNDFFHGRLASYDCRGWSLGAVVTRLGIGVQDLLSKLRLMGFGLGCVVVFKGRPEDTLLRSLRASGFQVVELPKNPYAKPSGEPRGI